MGLSSVFPSMPCSTDACKLAVVLLLLGVAFHPIVTFADDSEVTKDVRNERPAYAGPFAAITLDKLKDGFDVDPGLEKEVGEFIANTLFGSDDKGDKTDEKEKPKKSSEKKKSKAKKSNGAHSDSAQNAYGPYTPVPVSDDQAGYGLQRSKASKTVKSLRSKQPAVATIDQDDVQEDSAASKAAAIEVLTELGKSFERGQLTEAELSDFIKGIDLQLDDPEVLKEFETRNTAPVDGSRNVFDGVQADEPFGAPFMRSQNVPGVVSAHSDEMGPPPFSADECVSTMISCIKFVIEILIAIMIIMIILQLLAACTCIDLTSCFNLCAVREMMMKESPPEPKGSCFDNIPTACDLINLPCRLLGCVGGGGISICDFLPSGGRVPKKADDDDEDSCAGFMQSLCKGICAGGSGRKSSAGGGRAAPSATVADDDDEEYADDDGFLGGTNVAADGSSNNYSNNYSNYSIRDPSALYMAVKHQRAGHGSPAAPKSESSMPTANKSARGKPNNDFLHDCQPYNGPRKSAYGPNPILDDFTDDIEFVEPEQPTYGTGGFTTPYIDYNADEGFGPNESCSASQDALAGMHGYVPPATRSHRNRRDI